MITDIKNFTWNPKSRIFSTEASTLGLKPGDYPSWVLITNKDNSWEADFLYCGTKENSGELLYHIYTEDSGILLEIYND